MLVAHKAAGQGVGAGLVQGRVGFAHHSRAETGAVILGRSTVQAGAGNYPVALGGVPGQLAKGTVVVEVGIFAPVLLLVGIDAHTHAFAMFVGLRVDTADQLVIGPAPGGLDPRAEGAAVDVGGHWPGHHAGARRGAQGVVVHHMVGVVVVDLCFDLVENIADIGFFKAQAQAFALVLAAVHAAPGGACFAVAFASGEFEQGVGVGCPAEGDITVPFVVARGHGVAIAVLVIVGVGGIADHPYIAQRATGGGIDGLVEAAVGARQQAGIDPCTEFAEVLGLALEQDGACRGARAPKHALRALDHGELVVGFGGDIGGGCVHAPGAGAEHFAAVGEDIQA